MPRRFKKKWKSSIFLGFSILICWTIFAKKNGKLDALVYRIPSKQSTPVLINYNSVTNQLFDLPDTKRGRIKELSCSTREDDVLFKCKNSEIKLKNLVSGYFDVSNACKMGEIEVPRDFRVRSSGTTPNFFLAYSNIIKSKVNLANSGQGFVYEPTITNFMYILMKEYPCNSESITVDIGGNIGWYTGFFVSMGCHTISVEAQRFATVLLNSTIKASLLGKSTCVDVHNKAVTRISGEKVPMLGDTKGRGGNAHVLNSKENVLPKVFVEGTSVFDMVMNSYISAQILQRTKVTISMVKIDIEGSELHALKSLHELILSEKFLVSNIFVELSTPDIWLDRTGHTLPEAMQIFESYFGLGFCLRKVIYSDCCKSVYKKKVDKECCKTTSSRMWPNWTKLSDVPKDLLGDLFSNADQMTKYYQNPSLKSKVTTKSPLSGDFFLSNGAVCRFGMINSP